MLAEIDIIEMDFPVAPSTGHIINSKIPYVRASVPGVQSI